MRKRRLLSFMAKFEDSIIGKTDLGNISYKKLLLYLLHITEIHFQVM